MSGMAMTKAREELADLVNRVAYGRERLILKRRGRDVAALIPIEDLIFFERLEDLNDIRAARKAMTEAKAKREKPIPWEKVKKNLGLR